MKTEHERLELAANAVGNGAKWVCTEYEQTFKVPYKTKTTQGWTPWNPLEDDGDALRLAIAIGELDLMFLLSVHGDASLYNSDPAAAVRLAITKAAAAIQLSKEAP